MLRREHTLGDSWGDGHGKCKLLLINVLRESDTFRKDLLAAGPRSALLKGERFLRRGYIWHGREVEMKKYQFWLRCVIVAVMLGPLLGCSRDPNVRKQKYLASGNRYFET